MPDNFNFIEEFSSTRPGTGIHPFLAGIIGKLFATLFTGKDSWIFSDDSCAIDCGAFPRTKSPYLANVFVKLNATDTTDKPTRIFASSRFGIYAKRFAFRVMNGMVGRISNFKIFNAVVRLDLIFMMNYFRLCKQSAKVLFHHISMLKHIATIGRRSIAFEHYVPAESYIPTTFKIPSNSPPKRQFMDPSEFCKRRRTYTNKVANFFKRQVLLVIQAVELIEENLRLSSHAYKYTSLCHRSNLFLEGT